MLRITQFLLLCCCVFNSYAWNFKGHALVAQIAYNHLSPNAKSMCSDYLHSSHSKFSGRRSFVNAALWPDKIRRRGVYWYDKFHYIDIPFSTDATALPMVEGNNAVWAINAAVRELRSHIASSKDKQIALRILLHSVGDIHQPLHAVTRVSNKYPSGDKGGNLFKLGSNSVGKNLHSYWDNGAGLLINKTNTLESQAQQLERKWSCDKVDTESKPMQWAEESHLLAVNHAYTLNPKDNPSKQYKNNAQEVIEKQLVTAGCRLASVLNGIAQD